MAKKGGAVAKYDPGMVGAIESDKMIAEFTRYAERATLPESGVLSVDRLAKCAAVAIQNDPKLLNCTRSSLGLALIEAGQSGLEPSGILGQAYIVPFKNARGQSIAKFMPGYRGLIDLARRSGEIKTIESRVVYDGDDFRFALGLNQKLLHEPNLEDTEREEKMITHAYAIARLTNGGLIFEVMSRAQIEKIRQKSPAKNSGPWVDHYPEMCRKTVLKRLWKYLPSSYEAQAVVDYDNRIEAGEDARLTDDHLVEIEPQEEEDRTESLASRVADQVDQEPTEQIEAEIEAGEDDEGEDAKEHQALVAAFERLVVDFVPGNLEELFWKFALHHQGVDDVAGFSVAFLKGMKKKTNWDALYKAFEAWMKEDSDE
jgi:recombination protein RecT